ncbi:hypothetical protein [Brevundimonas sp.]|uniref:hypothetical protein n=1 Tax=Brevundimonas sp. TaxID=1871086 RepID=UPI00356B2C77
MVERAGFGGAVMSVLEIAAGRDKAERRGRLLKTERPYSATCKPVLAFRAVLIGGRFICLDRADG